MILFDQLNPRQRRVLEFRESRREAGDWDQYIEDSLRKGIVPSAARAMRIMGLYKDRWTLSQGQFTSEPGGSAWDIDCMPVADFGNATALATIRAGFNVLPLVNPFTALGSPDPEPFQVSGLLTAVSGDRQIGSSRLPVVICAGCFLVHSTGAAVFQPAATTFNLRVQNAVAAVAGALTTEATLAVNTAANFIDQVPIVASTGRVVGKADGSAITNVFALFNGDYAVGEMVAGASLQGNIIFAMLELL
jgi:hypothetical protein